MLTKHKVNLIQKIFCTIIFVFWVNVTHAMANKVEKAPQVTDEAFKELKTDVEFKNLVEKIFDLIANKYSTDDIIKIVDDPIKNSYDIQKLAKNIHELLEQQKSKGNIVNIVIESNKKNEEYSTNKKLKTFYVFLKIVAIVSASIGIYYLLSQYFGFPFLGKFGVAPNHVIDTTPEDETSSKKTLGNKNNVIIDQVDEPSSDQLLKRLHLDVHAVNLVKEQIEKAKRVGLITEQDCHGFFICEDEESKFFKMTLEEQVAYAEKVGLIKKTSDGLGFV